MSTIIRISTTVTRPPSSSLNPAASSSCDVVEESADPKGGPSERDGERGREGERVPKDEEGAAELAALQQQLRDLTARVENVTMMGLTKASVLRGVTAGIRTATLRDAAVNSAIGDAHAELEAYAPAAEANEARYTALLEQYNATIPRLRAENAALRAEGRRFDTAMREMEQPLAARLSEGWALRRRQEGGGRDAAALLLGGDDEVPPPPSTAGPTQ